MILKLFSFTKLWWHRSKKYLSQGTEWKGATLLAGCLITFVIYTWLPFSYFEMVGWPWIVPWQLGFLCAGGSLLWMLRQFKFPFQMLGYGLDWLALFTAVGLAISAAFSEFPTVAAWNLILVFCYFIVLYVLRNAIAASPNLAHLLWVGIAVCGAIAAFISLLYWQPDLSMWISGSFRAAIRNPFPLGHHNFVGGYFALVLPMILSFAAVQRGILRWGIGLASAITTSAIYISGSRGAYVGFLVYILAAMAIALWHSRRKQRKRTAALCVVVLLIVTIGIGSNPRVRDLISSIQLRSDTAMVQVGDGPTKDRWFMLKTAANILRDRPLLGVGPGNMSRVSHLYRPIETGVGLDHVQQLHNTPAQLAGELGMWGIAIYLGWIVLCGGLWLQIQSKPLEDSDRWLLYGIGGGFLAYGVSSLTDYQLENVGISSVLIINTALLIYLGDRYLSSDIQSGRISSQRVRRLWSLGIFAVLAVGLRLWIPMDMAVYLGHLGSQSQQAGSYATADQRWTAAASLIGSDPTYEVLAGEMLYELAPFANDSDSRQTLQAGVVDHFSAALAAAPYDVWFNQNLAIAYLNSGDLDNALRYAERTVQLLPRNKGYSYFLLGQLYLKTEQINAAITAFALQGLITPATLTMPFWRDSPFADIHTQVLIQTQGFQTELLTALKPQTPGYSRIYENWILLNWWFEREQPADLQTDRLRAVVQALLKADTAPEAALDILQAALTADPKNHPLLLLRAWINPNQFLDDFFTIADNSPQERQSLGNSLRNFRRISTWVASSWQSPIERLRGKLSLAYRNQDAEKIRALLYPDGLQVSTITERLDLFPTYLREMPALDRLIERVKTAELGLPHTTYNSFRLEL